MKCPVCAADDTRVVDSRPVERGEAVRRRRECRTCGTRFTTYERLARTMVRKRDGSVEPFEGAKIRRGLENALADRPLPPGTIERIVTQGERLARSGVAEISTEDIGRMVLEELRAVDEVAYLRFASVYKEFQGARDFEREMAALDEG